MEMIVIAVHYKDKALKNINGFRIFDNDTRKYMDVSYNQVMSVLKQGNYKISGLDIVNGEIHGDNGSLSRYAKMYNGKLVGLSPMVITKQIDNLGYEVVVFDGRKKTLKTEDVITLSEKLGLANAKVIEGNRISSIRGNYDTIKLNTAKQVKPEISIKKEETTINKNSEQVNKDTNSEDRLTGKIQSDLVKHRMEVAYEHDKNGNRRKVLIHPGFDGIAKPKLLNKLYGLDSDGLGNMLDPTCGLKVDEKLAKAINAIQDIRPFYGSALRTIEKRVALDCGTMGVTHTMLVYNPYFVLNTPLEELIFVVMHETMHLIMHHITRKGNRNHLIFNYATDFFVNKFLCHELGLGADWVDVTHTLKKSAADGESLDSVAERLKSRIELDDSNFKIVKNGDRYMAWTSKGNINGWNIVRPISILYRPDIDISSDTPEKIYDEIYKDFKFESQTTSIRNVLNNNSESQQEDDGQQGGGNQQGNIGSQQGNGDNITITKTYYKGNLVDTSTDTDIYITNEDKDKNENELDREARAVGQRAMVAYKKDKKAGEGQSNLERLYEEIEAPKVNWKSVLKNKFTKLSQKVTTYAAPDRRFISRNLVMPGPKKLDGQELENIRMCVDTSGSIDEQDLNEAIAYVRLLTKKFKADGEIWFWDYGISGKHKFKDKNDLKNIKPCGGGGTDVSYVFEEVLKEYKKKHVLPALIIIYTDGYFDYSDKHLGIYKKLFKDRVLWLITTEDCYKQFNIGWGTKVPVKYER